MKIKTNLLNGRLYWEGLKRLRVLGFGVAFLSMTVSALIPAIDLINDLAAVYRYNWGPYVNTWEQGALCYPLAFLPWLMPIFVLVMFSFLFKRKESDFYHAIPYTRTCVYTTYTAAVLTWVWGITALCALVSGILWAVNPYAIFSVGDLVQWTLASALSSTLLCAIMMLAVSLCGNIATTLLNFLVFAVLPRTTCFLLGILLNNGPKTMLIEVESFMGGFFTLKWFLPLSIFEFADIELDIQADFYDTPVYIYTAIVSVLLFVAAGFCYRIRKSETAGNSAPSGKVQHVFRILFTLPFALIATTLWIDDSHMVAYIMVVVLLLIYYLYELITTRQLKRLWKATPYLGVVLACCLAFLGIYQAIRLSVLYWEIEPEDIEQVEFLDPCYGVNKNTCYLDFNGDTLFPIKTDDPILIGAAADMVKDSQEWLRTSNPDYYRGSKVKLYLKNGLVITRIVREENDDLRNWFADQYPTFRQGILAFPKQEEVYGIAILELLYEDSIGEFTNERWGINPEAKYTEFLSLLQNEYMLLDDEEKYRVKLDPEMKYAPNVILISMRCSSANGGGSGDVFCITPDLLPDTHAWLRDYLEKRAES